MELIMMKEHAIGEITHIHMDTETKKRLCQFGIYEGAWIRMERKGRKGKPCTLLVCGNFLMMRYEDAKRIEVEMP